MADKQNTNNRLALWLPVAAVIVAALITTYKISCDAGSPQFVLTDKSFHSDKIITVRSANDAARKNKALFAEIDGFRMVGEPVKPRKENGEWYWRLPADAFPDSARTEAVHELRLGFDLGKMTSAGKIVFDRGDPEAGVTISDGTFGGKDIFAEFSDDNPDVNQKIKAEISFRYRGETKTIPVPLRRITDETGETFYELEYSLQSLPLYTPGDPEFYQPYFALVITDEAGNQFRRVATYNKFIATGEEYFGNRDIEAKLERLDAETFARRYNKSPEILDIPAPHNEASGNPLIALRIVLRERTYVKLSWTRLPPELRPEQERFTIFGDEREIGVSFDTTFVDDTPFPTEERDYRVLAEGTDGKEYPSNIAKTSPDTTAPPPPAITLRKEPRTLAESDIQAILDQYDFWHTGKYDLGWENPDGKGVDNRFQRRQNGALIHDATTGLTWQQSGSDSALTYAEAEKYIDRLNQERFGGFSDWRLPTLEEAMSLMEPRRSSARLYIDPIFDAKQPWIWTADKASSGAWYVYFYLGYCDWYGLVFGYVRAVRF